MENAAANNKRSRNEDSSEMPDSKRIRADLLLSILDDEPEPDNTDIDSVIRSLEEEIALPRAAVSGTGADEVSDPDPKQPDLGFLLEASDDELGLPPPGTAEGDVTSGEVTLGADAEAVGFGKIWGIDDDFYLDFGIGSDDGKDDNGEDDGAVIFDGGLFETELTWLTEYLPAV